MFITIPSAPSSASCITCACHLQAYISYIPTFRGSLNSLCTSFHNKQDVYHNYLSRSNSKILASAYQAYICDSHVMKMNRVSVYSKNKSHHRAAPVSAKYSLCAVPLVLCELHMADESIDRDCHIYQPHVLRVCIQLSNQYIVTFISYVIPSHSRLL